MYLTFKSMQGFSVKTFEQEIVGHIKSFYLDELTWTVRYIIIDAILSPDKKSAIITPVAVDRIKPAERMVTLSLKTEQFNNSPEADDVMPFSREKEIELAERYEWPAYWTNMSASMPGVVEELADTKVPQEEQKDNHNHLRDMNEIISYHLVAQGDRVGVVDDFIVGTDTWHTAFVIVDTAPILPGKQVLLPPTAISGIDWQMKSVTASTTAHNVKKAPHYTSDTLEKLQVD
jgi:hypothetical protein